MLMGSLAPSESQRLEVARPAVESMLESEYGLPLAVRFLNGNAAEVEPSAEATTNLSVEEYASQIFGGRLIMEDAEATAGADAASTAGGMMAENG
jgi:hypothetical protein